MQLQPLTMFAPGGCVNKETGAVPVGLTGPKQAQWPRNSQMQLQRHWEMYSCSKWIQAKRFILGYGHKKGENTVHDDGANLTPEQGQGKQQVAALEGKTDARSRLKRATLQAKRSSYGQSAVILNQNVFVGQRLKFRSAGNSRKEGR
ncbi:unnamed protein product [Symbiodinium microadriaticum]|nr:unnamed protein product [Symbiodinium microadriaticum]